MGLARPASQVPMLREEAVLELLAWTWVASRLLWGGDGVALRNNSLLLMRVHFPLAA